MDFTAQQQAYGIIKQAQQQGNRLSARITALQNDAELQAAKQGLHRLN